MVRYEQVCPTIFNKKYLFVQTEENHNLQLAIIERQQNKICFKYHIYEKIFIKSSLTFQWYISVQIFILYQGDSYISSDGEYLDDEEQGQETKHSVLPCGISDDSGVVPEFPRISVSSV